MHDEEKKESKWATAVSIAGRIAGMGLAVAAAVLMATASQCTVYAAYGARPRTVTYSDFPPFVYLVGAASIAAFLEAIAIFLVVWKKGKDKTAKVLMPLAAGRRRARAALLGDRSRVRGGVRHVLLLRQRQARQRLRRERRRRRYRRQQLLQPGAYLRLPLAGRGRCRVRRRGGQGRRRLGVRRRFGLGLQLQLRVRRL